MELKIKKEVEETININLPIFWKKESIGELKLVGIIDEKNAIKLLRRANFASLQSHETWLMQSEIKDAVNDNWEEISEVAFMALYEKELLKFSFMPTLSEIDQEIENELNRSNH